MNHSSDGDEAPATATTRGEQHHADREAAFADARRHLGWAQLTEAFVQRLRSPVARSRGAEAFLDPRMGRAQARARLDEQRGLEQLFELESNLASPDRPRLRGCLRDLEDLEESLRLAARGAELSVYELVAVADLGRAADVLSELLDRCEGGRGVEVDVLAPLRARLGPAMDDLTGVPSLVSRLDRSIDRDGEAPRVSSDASEELRRARAMVRSRRQALVQRADRLVRRTELSERLSDRYWTEREGRVVLPVRSDAMQGLRGEGAIIHGSSATGQTMFVEPGALVADNNALREAHQLERAEERKVLLELGEAVGELAGKLQALQGVLVAIDELAARLELADTLDARAPVLVEPRDAFADTGSGDDARTADDGLVLEGARHPLMILDGVDVVPNDLRCRCGGALVISGPNAGGKTVALKTVGLCVLMASAGLRVPTARPARVPVFRRVVTDVGDDQSIAANLSTFTAHMRHVEQALEAVREDGPGALVLFDEVAVGTDPEQGAALAEAVLVHLVEAGATVMVTTHYERLKLLATGDPERGRRFANAAVGFDIARMRPTYRLHLGTPGASSAIAVARRLGLDEAVLGEAERLLGDEGLKVDVLLRQIADEKEQLARAREKLDHARDKLARQRDALKARERKILDGARSRKARAFDAATRELNQLEGDLKKKRREIRKAEKRDEMPRRGQVVPPAERKLERHIGEGARDDGGEAATPAELTVGDRVKVKSLRAEGEVVAFKGSGRVVVQLPLMKTTVPREDVRRLGDEERSAPPSKIKAGKAEPIFKVQRDFETTSQPERHFGDDAVPVHAGIDNTVDVRGMRGEDACDAVESFLAEALSRDHEVVVVRHGHGSGALRKMVRERLRGIEHARKVRGGLSAEGGDAVTVVWVG